MRFIASVERSGRGLVTVGVLVHDADSTAQAGLSVSMPSVRYDPRQLQPLVAALSTASRQLEAGLSAAT